MGYVTSTGSMVEQFEPKAMKKDRKFYEWTDAPILNRNLIERSAHGDLDAKASGRLNTTVAGFARIQNSLNSGESNYYESWCNFLCRSPTRNKCDIG